jgi:hypothetical protein
MSYRDVQRELKQRGYMSTGGRDVIILRLIKAREDAAKDAEAPQPTSDDSNNVNDGDESHVGAGAADGDNGGRMDNIDLPHRERKRKSSSSLTNIKNQVKKRKSRTGASSRKPRKLKDPPLVVPTDNVDIDLLVPKDFDVEVFSPSSQLFVGNIFALFDSNNSVTALYQAVNPVAAALIAGTGSQNVAVPAASKYMVLSQKGLSAIGSIRTPVDAVFIVEAPPPLSVLSVLSPKSSGATAQSVSRASSTVQSVLPEDATRSLTTYPDYTTGIDGDVWDTRREKFRDGVGFRIMCFNVESVWSDTAGPACSLDSIVSLTRLKALVPLRLRSLPVCESKTMGAFARLMFAVPNFKASFPRSEKKEDSVHLGHFLHPHEKFTSVNVIRLALSRLVTLLGAISTFPDEWSDIFTLLTRLFDASAQWNITDWDVRYVFKFVHGLLGQLSSTAVSPEARGLRKDELVGLLGSVFEVNYSLELSMYLADQRRYDSFAKNRLSSSTTSAGSTQVVSSTGTGGSGTAGSSSSSGVARSTQNGSAATVKRDGWCIKHAAVQLNISSKPCDTSCGRPHPQLSNPLTPGEKTTLKSVAGSIKESDFKRKFLAALV